MSPAYTNTLGSYGGSWTRISISSSAAHAIGFRTTSINPSDYSNRWAGTPLRCQNTSQNESEEEKGAPPTTIVHLPLAFVRSGNIYLDLSLDRPTYRNGDRGVGWSRTSQEPTTAYYPNFALSSILSSAVTLRWDGFSLRYQTSLIARREGGERKDQS